MKGTLRDQQRARTRARILRIAAEEFDRRGFAAVALSEIAARLEMTKGTVYFHFPTKAALASAVVDTYFSAWESLERQLAAQGLRGLRALRWLCTQVAQSYREDSGARAPLRLMREVDVIGIDLPTPFLPWIETVARHLLEAQQLNEIRQDLELEEVAWQLVAGFFGAQEISHQLSDGADIAERIDTMWSLLLPGLQSGPTQP